MLNGFALNTAALNSDQAPVLAVGAGALVSFEDIVARIGSGQLAAFEDDVRLQLTGSGVLAAIEDSVVTVSSGELFVFEDRVVDSAVVSKVDKYGWNAFLTVGGLLIPAGEIHGTIDITRTENSAALMDFTMINMSGVIDFNQWHGKTVTLDIETPDGVTRAYTGVVDIPEIDLVNYLITLRCTDKRTEQINNQLANELPYIGSHSTAIFDEPDDVADELSQRLQTTTRTVDFDAYGNYTVSDFLPKASPDFTFNDAAIYRRKPALQVASRGRLINQVNIDFEFRYVRLRHRQRSFRLEGPQFCDVMTTPGLAFLSSTGIKSNLDSFGWTVKESSIVYEDLPPGGVYSCGPNGVQFIWSPVSHNVQTGAQTDEDGNVVTDSNGNTVYEVKSSVSTDYTKAFATAVDWVASKQFAQDVTQKTTIQINAPQSQGQYGIIEKSQRNGLDVEYDADEFEKNEEYKTAPDDFIPTGTDSYQDQYGTLKDYKDALDTVIAIAATSIAKSHRDNHVTIQVPIMPEIDLKHTVELTAGVIQAKGKVSQIRHSLNIGTMASETSIRLSLSQAIGSQVNDELSIPISAAPLVGDDYAGTLTMRTYGDYQVGIGSGQNTSRELGVITPAIDDESRSSQTVEASYAANISIRNDTLQVVF